MGIGYGNHVEEGPGGPTTGQPAPPSNSPATPPAGSGAATTVPAESGTRGTDEAENAKTPGQGSLPDDPQGDEVDPGVG